jgi:transcriptional regulator with XRE-family HTH domain
MQKNLRNIVRRGFGMALKNMRDAAGLSQEQLAGESDVERGYVSRLEGAQHTPNLETIYKLLPVLKISFEQFAAEMDKCVRRVRRE